MRQVVDDTWRTMLSGSHDVYLDQGPAVTALTFYEQLLPHDPSRPVWTGWVLEDLGFDHLP